MTTPGNNDLLVYIRRLEQRVSALEANNDRQTEELRVTRWIRDLLSNPAAFEEWQPITLHARTGYVMRHMKDATGVMRPTAILITDENKAQVELAQQEWAIRNPELYERYRSGPKGKVIVVTDREMRQAMAM